VSEALFKDYLQKTKGNHLKRIMVSSIPKLEPVIIDCTDDEEKNVIYPQTSGGNPKDSITPVPEMKIQSSISNSAGPSSSQANQMDLNAETSNELHVTSPTR
jgi:hypothetical protein